MKSSSLALTTFGPISRNMK